MAGDSGGGGAYDISASLSNSATQGAQFGDQIVGGGVKIPGWVWGVAAAIGAAWAIKKLFFSK